METPKKGEKYRHFKGNDYQIVDVENGIVKYFNLNEHSGFKVGTEFFKKLGDFCRDKCFQEDSEFNGIKYKKGECVERFVQLED